MVDSNSKGQKEDPDPLRWVKISFLLVVLIAVIYK